MADIRSALEDAFRDAEAPEVETKPVEAQETVQEAPEQRARDDAGRFAAKVQDAPIPAPEPVLDTAGTVPERKAPSSWKPDAQTAWLKADRGEALTPAEVKLLAQEAERREGDFHKGVAEFKTHSERARAYDQAIAPYRDTIKSLGVDEATAIGALLKADHTLRYADPATKAQYFAQLARQYGIDMGQVAEPPQVDPQTQYLMQQLQELRQTQQSWQNSIQQQERQRAEQELAAFSTGKPHLDAVREDMARLLETGVATSLQDAYDRAVWMRPDVRQTLIESERQEAQRKATEQATLNRARSAAVSVKGSSPAGAGQPSNQSLRDTIAAAFAND